MLERVTLVSELQLLKTDSPNLVTELGMIKVSRLLQYSKAEFPIVVSALGRITLLRLLQ